VTSDKRRNDATAQPTGVETRCESGHAAGKGLSRLGPRKRGKNRKEIVRGQEYSDSGQLVNKVRIIDRENNKYKEQVSDADTGEIIRDVEHPLTDHTEHGSAKFKKRTT
jgi:hypothetical protein